MKKVYKVPVYMVKDIGPYNLTFIDNILVSKSRFGYKELFTRYSIKCIDSEYNSSDESDIINRVVIFKKDLNKDNVIDADMFIEYSAEAPNSMWKKFYDENLKRYDNGDNPDNKVLRKYKENIKNF